MVCLVVSYEQVGSLLTHPRIQEPTGNIVPDLTVAVHHCTVLSIWTIRGVVVWF